MGCAGAAARGPAEREPSASEERSSDRADVVPRAASSAQVTEVDARTRRRRNQGRGAGEGAGSSGPGPSPGCSAEQLSSAGSPSSASAPSVSGAGTAASADTAASAGPAVRTRCRASTANNHSRCSSSRSFGVASQKAASRSTGAKSCGTASPAQYRCSVEVFMLRRRASEP
ncbi:hypothetical protein SAV14893_084480 [Streptomyces avermitilis]|uniref:Uncharacterized protein n=1 Tax=Streptomyces avermitilis TaxID=33903 RepID=A0A4D4MB17_STRAX|nr:hypothetical protein SAV14893_084480 [Streptomyces avermitilis]